MQFKIIAVLVLVLLAYKTKKAWIPAVIYTLLTAWSCYSCQVAGIKIEGGMPLQVAGAAILSYLLLWLTAKFSEDWRALPAAIAAVTGLFAYPFHFDPSSPVGMFGAIKSYIGFGLGLLFLIGLPLGAITHCLTTPDLNKKKKLLWCLIVVFVPVAALLTPLKDAVLPVSSFGGIVYFLLGARSKKLKISVLVLTLATVAILFFEGSQGQKEDPSIKAWADRVQNMGRSASTGSAQDFRGKLSHRVHLKNGQTVEAYGVKRDVSGMWVEMEAGSSAFFSDKEVERVENLV